MYPEYEHDYAGYCRDILGIVPTDKQLEIGHSVDVNERTAVASCHASGKSFNAGAISNWWIDTRDPSVVLTTAPTGRQVRRVIWREIRKLRAHAKRKLPGRMMQVEIRISDQRFAMGFSSDNPDAVQGLRESRNVLIIEDESPGVDGGVVEALETILTDPSSRHLKQGNPTTQHGHFFDCFHSQRDRWNCIEISAFDTPNLKAGRIVIPGLVTSEWVADRRRKWGDTSPLWKTRVLGKFSSMTGQKVVPTDWAAAAAARWTEEPFETIGGTMGVDIASSGQDRTVITLLVNGRLMEIDAFQVEDLMEIAARVVERVVELKPACLNVDATGLGLGVFHRLEQMQESPDSPLRDVEVCGIVLGSSASEECFPRLVDELQWNMRMAIDPTGEQKIAIRPTDTDLLEQLSLRGWSLDARSRIKVESKNELRKRGAHSPDSGDSAMLCFHESKPLIFR